MKDIVVFFDPTIELKPLSINDTEIKYPETTFKYSKFAGEISPFCSINGAKFYGENITYFELDVASFIPTVSISIHDSSGLLIGEYYPMDGDVLQVYMRSQNSDFKDIRQDFKILNVTQQHGGNQGGNFTTFMITGILDVPMLFVDRLKSFSSMTSFETLMLIAKELKLGFASNVTSTNDRMTWLCPSMDYHDMMLQEIMPYIYKDDSSFFTLYIDERYYLTLVEINSMIVLENNVDLESSSSIFNAEWLQDDNDAKVFENSFFLSNSKLAYNTPNQITVYVPISDSGNISSRNGYRTYLQYYDKEAKDYAQYFIDTLNTLNTTDDYKIMKGNADQDYTEYIRTKWMNSQNGRNVHPNYMHAVVQNTQNMLEISKFNLLIDLITVNTNLYRYKIAPILLSNWNSEFKDQRMAQDNKERSSFIIDQIWSGWYTVSGIRYIYSKNRMYNQIVCSKREFKIPEINYNI